MPVGIIGGTGFLHLDMGPEMRFRDVETPYGYACGATGVVGDRHVIFLPRHGSNYRVPPHKINYRANIDALRRMGCKWVLATNAVGALRPDLKPGDILLPDQFLDFTKWRPSTFFDGGEDEVKFVDMTTPYCPDLRNSLRDALVARGVTPPVSATYVCTEGPRFETPAEIKMFAGFGGDLVGMTGVPEVILAREAGICYASLCIVSNLAAGLKGEPLNSQEVVDIMEERGSFIRDVLFDVVTRLDPEAECATCRPPGEIA